MKETAAEIFGEQFGIVRHVHGQVAEHIGRAVIKGEITPGDALPSELRICEMMGVSRSVVREAIRVLTAKGIVETRQKSGTRVRSPEHWNHLDPDVLRWRLDVTDLDTYLSKLFQLRNALDPIASELAAEAANPENKEFIRAAWEAMVEAKNNDEFVAADIAFHKGIYFATQNEFFWPIAQMFELVLRQSFGIAATGDHRGRALEEHRAVMEAILDGDRCRARDTTVTLLRHSTTDLVVIRGKNPFTV